MQIKRTIQERLKNYLLNSQKIVLLYGARQTGKTTLSNVLLNEMEGKILKINADEIKYIELLSSRDFSKMKLLLDGYDILFIDEAQRIPDAGINLKIIHDNMPELKMLVTGSSSFELAGKVKEPLTGRTITNKLFPLSVGEIHQYHNLFEIRNLLDEYMIYGLYPEVLQYANSSDKERYLTELTSSYLYKDVLELSNIRNSSRLNNLLKLLAFQIGSEVSLSEIGKSLNLSQETVSSYIDLLEKSFVLFRLTGFSRNLRKEVTKKDKIFFWDLGVRNAVISNFSSLQNRPDFGTIWENFIISERLKYLNNNEILSNSWFWRTYTGAEIDYIEEINGELSAYEIKYRKYRKNPPQTWREQYNGNYKCINVDNFPEFLV